MAGSAPLNLSFYRHYAVLRLALIMAVFLVVGCAGGQSESVVDESLPLELSASNLAGRWNRQAELDGRRVPLYVDSLFTFDSVVDTLFRYRYRIRGESLVFEDAQGTVTPIRVLKLTADSLVLSDLPFTDRILRFRRGSLP